MNLPGRKYLIATFRSLKDYDLEELALCGPAGGYSLALELGIKVQVLLLIVRHDFIGVI